MARRLGALLLGSVLLTFFLACGDDTGGDASSTTSGSGGGGGVVDDGKVRPATNGVAISEADACAAVESAFQRRASALQCAATARSCPDLIRAPSGAPVCAQYDEGAAEGCAEYVEAAADCEDLRGRPDVCIVAPVEGSEPAGCPS